MRLTPVHDGAPVRAEGALARLRDGWVVVAPGHVEGGDVRAAAWLRELRVDDLDLAVPLEVDGRADLDHGAPVVVQGRWSGRAVVVGSVVPAPARPNPGEPPPWPVSRPPGVPGPPTALEAALLEDGTLTARLPYGDGTLHVVADDVARATELLAPLYGAALRVEQAVFTRARRAVARAALRTLDERGVAMCAVGDEVLDDHRPAETVHTVEVPWVTEELAAVLAPVADGLVRVTAHVEVVSAPPEVARHGDAAQGHARAVDPGVHVAANAWSASREGMVRGPGLFQIGP